jgi:iron complex outermembrane receptor protein
MPAWALVLCAASSYCAADETIVPEDWQDVPVVLTATRLDTPLSQIPASVTVLDADLIRSMGNMRLVEVFRFVPGMQVGYEHGYQPVVTYHGMTDEHSRRLQVLINGRSIYQPALARILWSDLPLPIDLIQRIEVIRGPNTASYGANAFLAIINIVTEHPRDLQGWMASVRVGNDSNRDAVLGKGVTVGAWALQWTFQDNYDDGFALDNQGGKRSDEQRRWAIRVDAATDWDDSTLRIQGGYKDGSKTTEPLQAEITPEHDIDTRFQFLQANYEKQISATRSRTVQVFVNDHSTQETWQSCIPRLFLTDELYQLFESDSAYAESLVQALLGGMNPPAPPPALTGQAMAVLSRALTDGSITTCGFANQNVDETRWDIEWQENFAPRDDLRTLVGFNIRRDSASAESFFSGSVHRNMARVFAHAEWRLNDAVVFNAGANVEHDNIGGTEWAPRLGVNALVRPNVWFRAVASRATRSPDLFESRGFRRYQVRALNPVLPDGTSTAFFYQHDGAKQDLSAETTDVLELGLHYSNAAQNLDGDIKWFHESFDNLIEGPTFVFDFAPDNMGSNTQQGVEGQLDWKPSASQRFWMTLAYLDSKDGTSSIYARALPTWSGSFSWRQAINERMRFALNGIGNSLWFGQPYSRLDAVLSYEWPLAGGWRLETSAVWRYRIEDDWLFDTNNQFGDSSSWMLQFRLSEY